MSDDVITSSATLDDERRAILNAIADTLLPASTDGRMPSAGELDVWAYLAHFAPDGIGEVLEMVGQFDADFAALPLDARVGAMTAFSESEPGLVRAVLTRVYGCYYQHDAVMEGIGLAKGPPFPRGNSVESGDLSLLDPVNELDRTYRTK